MPRISYGHNNTLRYAWYNGVVWQTEQVDASVNTGGHSSLAIDAAGHPHISYYDNTGGNLRYAYHDGASWEITIVDYLEDVGEYTSLALDSAGHPHISYYNYDNQDLKYAYYDGAEWRTETVDVTGSVGMYTSLALDAFDLPHISYFDGTGLNLKYVYHDGIAWQMEFADSPGNVGSFTSLALDGDGLTHISYKDNAYVSLKYAYQTCLQVSGAQVDGPTFLLRNEAGVYTAAYFSPIATPPVTFTWNNGSAGPTAVYSWTQPGMYTVTVDVANPCGEADGNLLVQVCQEVAEAQVDGPANLPMGVTGTYTATYLPITATTPVTITWDNGTVGPTAPYSWAAPGDYTVAVTVTNPCGEAYDTFPVTVFCQPLEDVAIDGPADLPFGVTGIYTATALPLTATTPMTYSWDNGTVGPTAGYSWTVPGTHTIAVTVTNYCGEVYGSYTVTMFCQPLAGVNINGPAQLPVGEEGTFQATPLPITATLPITYTWDDGTSGPTAVYSWTLTGTHIIAVTATNSCGVQVSTDWEVEVFEPLFRVYLPIVER